MGTHILNNYIFKALDAYPYELEKATEALNYALSYDEKDTMALCLKGRIYAETLKDYDKAKTIYTEALAENVKAFHIYPHYINVLLWNEDYEEAMRFIDFALKVKGSDKVELYHKQAILFEQQKLYKKALIKIKLAKRFNYDSNNIYDLKETESRIKDKMPKKAKKKKK